ncbi:hypothetical protein [Agromyces humi]|uniref:hypothetical protein n=1 Tax=Agromyces humi TaxID=1766800 RepID=UPI001358707C|nr:hypothetical protein [Agromyces humi]
MTTEESGERHSGLIEHSPAIFVIHGGAELERHPQAEVIDEVKMLERNLDRAIRR